MKTLIPFLAALIFARVAYAQETSTAFFDLNDDGVENIAISSFKNPPLSYAPFVRWWWPGNDVETKELQREIDLFARQYLVNRIPPPIRHSEGGANP